MALAIILRERGLPTCLCASKYLERERGQAHDALKEGPLGIDFGLLEEGLSPSAHGLALPLGTCLYTCMHALHAILLDFFHWLRMPCVHALMLPCTHALLRV